MRFNFISPLSPGAISIGAILVSLLWLIALVFRSISDQATIINGIDRILEAQLNPGVPEFGERLQFRSKTPTKIAIFVTGIGNYVKFATNLIDSGRKYLLVADNNPNESFDIRTWKNQFDIIYYLFTDKIDDVPKVDYIRPVFQKRMGWPGDSMLRPELYLNFSKNVIKDEQFDFFYSIDADNVFLNPVGTEFLGDLVGVMHWMHFDKPIEKMPFDDHQGMCAHVRAHNGAMYYSAAVYGGRRSQIEKMWRWMADCTQQYAVKNEVPSYHDESLLNKYFDNNPPSLILSPQYYNAHEGYGYWQGPRKLVFIDKNYTAARGE